LQQVVWGDLHLDHERPHVIVRASTTKNRKDALLPLHPQLLAELKAIQTNETKAEDFVFSQHGHPDRRIQIDLAAAGIPKIDAMGRKLDFHALRYTFATKLASSGVSQRLAQELMRHSDPRLTANIYTDVTQLPTSAAVNGLPWQGKSLQAASLAGDAGNISIETHTAIDPHSLDFWGPNKAGLVTVHPLEKSPTNPYRKSLEHVVACFATNRKILGATGFEPQGDLGYNPDAQRVGENKSGPITAIDPHDVLKLGAGVGFEPTTFRL